MYLLRRRGLAAFGGVAGCMLWQDHVAFCETEPTSRFSAPTVYNPSAGRSAERNEEAAVRPNEPRKKARVWRVNQTKRMVMTKRRGKKLESRIVPMTDVKKVATSERVAAAISSKTGMVKAWRHSNPSRLYTVCNKLADVVDMAIGANQEVYCLSRRNFILVDQTLVNRKRRFDIDHIDQLYLKQVDCSSVHCAALTVDGEVFTWATVDEGTRHGQMGTKRKIEPYTLKRIRLPIEAEGGMDQIGVSDCHTLMVDHSGRLWGTGGNWVLRTDPDLNASQFEDLWDKGVRIKDLAVGGDKILARSETGNVWVVADALETSRTADFVPRVSRTLTRNGYTSCLKSAHSCACASGEAGIVCEGMCPLNPRDYSDVPIHDFDLAENTFVCEAKNTHGELTTTPEDELEKALLVDPDEALIGPKSPFEGVPFQPDAEDFDDSDYTPG